MPNLVTDGNFEGGSPWSSWLKFPGSTVTADYGAFNGSFAGALEYGAGGGGGLLGAMTSINTGRAYTSRFAVKQETAGAVLSVIPILIGADGPRLHVFTDTEHDMWRFDEPSDPDPVLVSSVPFTATDWVLEQSADIKIPAAYSPAGAGNWFAGLVTDGTVIGGKTYNTPQTGRWLVDRIIVRDAVFTNVIENAIVQDLKAIDGNSPFSTDLGSRVYQEPDMVEDMAFPCAELHSGSGDGSVEDVEGKVVSDVSRERTETWIVKMWVRSSTPRADLNDLKDDVVNAVTRSTSNVCAAAQGSNSVIDVNVLTTGGTRTDDDISSGFHNAEAAISVRYYHVTGEL